MKHAFVFPGQGSQFSGMGKSLYENSVSAKRLYEQANEVLGFRISDIMFTGSNEDLKQTNVTQPAIFLHSVVAYKSIESAKPDMVAGHSLGEFSALVANGVLSFEDALMLVAARSAAMQNSCEIEAGAMAAVIALPDEKVVEICESVEEEVVAANFNCPGQVVISGSKTGVDKAAELLKAAGARKVLFLPVSGAFHSPLMIHAEEELISAIEKVTFHKPTCPIYQNVVAKAVLRPEEIKMNLIHQLTGAVKWTQSIESMIADGASKFTEVGPGKVLQGLIQKINKEMIVEGVS